MSVCPICNGAGKKIHVVSHGQSKIPVPCVEWCLCTKSRTVSESPNNPILSYLGEKYMPLKNIDKELDFDPSNLTDNPFLFIYNTPYNDFCYHLKSFIMKYRFSEPSPLIFCCTSIDILHKFYVKQDDESCLHLSGTNVFDLLVVTLGTKEKNNQLNTCISQIIYNRICNAKPIWLYAPYSIKSGIGGQGDLNNLLNQCTYEHSKDLEDYVWRNFKHINLKPSDMKPGVKKTKAAAMATNFKRTVIKESKPEK